ncbi:MAG: hypothetical protein HC898_05975 [Phycisphaerales bacterium]|nr:hypothetical protein [Phycisphaerales bacterium]
MVRELQFDGPPPLPWRIGLAQYDSLRALSAARIDNQGPSRDIGTQLYALVQMVAADSHPLNLRLAAKAMSGPKLLTLAKSGDDVYNVSRAILDGKDPAARAQIISDLVSISPATPATLDLLKVAARNADPGTQLLALRGLAQSGNTDPEVINLLTETANRLIVDANAPDPVTVLAEIFAAARAGSPENRANPESFYPFDLNTAPSTTNTPESTNINKLLAQQVQLKFTDPLRRDMVIAALLATSNTEPLAAHWINTQLLSGADPSLAQRTLELLANAKLVPLPETVGRTVKLQLPHYALTLDELFGQVPQPPSDSSTPKPKPYATPPQQPFQIQLAEPFIITQGSHNYFKLLSSPNPPAPHS